MPIVLMYHDVFKNAPSESGFEKQSMLQYKISEEIFEGHVRSISNYCKNHHNNLVIFSFDDGGSSFITIIAPILEKYGIRGLFFICTKYINTKGFLSTEQVVDLEKRGHVVGSHSYSHPDNILDISKEKQEEEWVRSISDLESILGHKVTLASIPNGYVNKGILDIIKEVGVDTVYTSLPTTDVKEYNGLKVAGRYVIQSGMNIQDVKKILSSPLRREMLSLRWKFLNLIKLLLGEKYNSFKRILLR